ncbi:MAG: T9SS type A sorting domain-containing protein [Ignavibacteriae bacterium]|nr:T9SS type A sorting domain-containing protein [Ignavibacteriota bacterium]
MKYFLEIWMLLICFVTVANAQQRRFEVHNRGILRQSVYNTGELGRAYVRDTTNVPIGNPSFEWPGHSAIVVDNVQYTGQHNSFGGGVQLAVNRRDTSRMYVYCGGVSQLPVSGVYSFPLSLTRTENFPLLPDGSLNPFYDADEAEERIVSSWATPAGISITRTSRTWSAPDYDDFVVYEYALENTGDTDGDPFTPARQDTLTELLVSFSHGLTPGKTGHERKYNRWDGLDFQQTDTYARFDRRRWLNYAENLDGLPDPRYFQLWAQTNTNGGGLQAPMSVGYMVLYYDTTRLARRGESNISVPQYLDSIVWDANYHLKQPYLNRLETSLWTEAKYVTNMNILSYPRTGNSPYSNRSVFGDDWIGRGSFNVRQSWVFGVGRQIVFGPYILKPAERIRFAIAEVAGFGSAGLWDTRGGLKDEGGSCGQVCNESATTHAFNSVTNLIDTVVYGADAKPHGSRYLSTYQLPDYVNSNVVTIRDVADRAIQVYTGSAVVVDYDSSQYWPERAPERGAYGVQPIPVPSPMIAVRTRFDSVGGPVNVISWRPAVEGFSSPRLRAPFSHYRVLRALSPLGPWVRVDSVGRRDPRYFCDSVYMLPDTTSLGALKYYMVYSIDSCGGKSGMTNLTRHEAIPTAVRDGNAGVPRETILEQNYPNPFNPSTTIRFNVEKMTRATLVVFNLLGQKVSTLFDDIASPGQPYTVAFNGDRLPSGVYFCRLQASSKLITRKLMLLK